MSLAIEVGYFCVRISPLTTEHTASCPSLITFRETLVRIYVKLRPLNTIYDSINYVTSLFVVHTLDDG